MTALTHCGVGTLIVLWVSTGITAVVFGLMVYSIVRFCKSPQPNSVRFIRRTAIEVAWAVIPILIVIVTATPAVTTLLVVNNSCPVAADFR